MKKTCFQNDGKKRAGTESGMTCFIILLPFTLLTVRGFGRWTSSSFLFCETDLFECPRFVLLTVYRQLISAD